MLDADNYHDLIEQRIGKVLGDLASDVLGASVEYSDGYYILFADGSSLSVALTSDAPIPEQHIPHTELQRAAADSEAGVTQYLAHETDPDAGLEVGDTVPLTDGHGNTIREGLETCHNCDAEFVASYIGNRFTCPECGAVHTAS